MGSGDIPFIVDQMGLDDIEQVMAIEKAAFSAPWSARAYHYELTENPNAHFFVVYLRGAGVEPAPAGWWARLLRWVRGPVRSARFIVGYGGFWQVLDEAHISTIAVRPEFRQLGIGKLLMVTMLKHAIALEAERATLEVRVSNQAAQGLYRLYGFEVTGRRPRYYSDNFEDALIMTVKGILTPAYRRRLAELEQAVYRELAAQHILQVQRT